MSHEKAIKLPSSEFRCDICDYKTLKKEMMRQHTVVKHSEIRNKCPDCAYTHYFPGQVRRHFQYVHMKDQTRPRRSDGRKDCFEIDCKNTQKDVCKEMGHNKASCKQCNYSSFTTDTMRRHVKTKHEGKLYSCNQCDFKSARTDQILTHTARIHDGVLFRCDRCDLAVDSKDALKSHNYYHHSDKTFECGKCNYKSEQKCKLRKHEKMMHTTVDCFRKYCKTGSKEDCRKLGHHKLICKICKYMAHTKGAMEKHTEKPHNPRQNCEYCSYDTDRKSLLKKHVLAKHKQIAQTEANENFDNYEEGEFVKDKQIQNYEEKESNEAEKLVPPIIRCKVCNYSSQNEDISKLHFLSHIYSETEILQNFPPSLRNLTFATEGEFSENLDLLLKSLPQKVREATKKEEMAYI